MRGTYISTRPVTNTYLVRERDRRRIRELLIVLALALPPAAGVLANIWVHGEVVSTGYTITDQEERLAELERRQRRLELELSQESSPARIETRARDLGLVEPELEQVRAIEDLP